MIQFNLLPDVKLEYIKAERTKRLVMASASIVTAVSLAVLIILVMVVNVINAKTITDLRKDITATSDKIKETPELDKILTVQNQLNNLSMLHDQKPVVSKLNGFIQQLTPDTVTISEFEVDFEESVITVSGAALDTDVTSKQALSQVNKFVDSVKFTTFMAPDPNDSQKKIETPAFKDVVLEEFERGKKEASYTIKFSFDPIIFDSNANISLQRDSRLKQTEQITTRSLLFKPQQNEEGTQ